MKKLSKIWHILFIAMLLVFASQECMAQLKLDPGKTAGKFTDWVQKQYENFQSTMEQISQSQFATTIGDGIKAAKEGVEWAKKQYSTAMKFYNDTKDSVVNSTEYKAALISKQIADETVVLEKMQKDKESKLTELKEDARLQKETLTAKLEQAQENLLNGASILQEELDAADDEEKKKEIRDEIDAFKLSVEEENTKINEEIANIDTQLGEDIKAIDLEFAEQIYTQGEKIADLTMQLKELLENDKKGKGEEDPSKVIEEAKSKFSFEEGVSISLKDRKEKDRQKRSSQTTAMLNVMSEAATNISSSDDIKEEDEMTTSVSETQAGKSDSVYNGAHRSTLTQIDSLYKYLKLELRFLETETLRRIANDDTQVKKVDDATAVIDICSYDEDSISDKKAIKMFKKWGEKAIQEAAQEATKNNSERLNEELPKSDKLSNKVKKYMNDTIGTMGM